MSGSHRHRPEPGSEHMEPSSARTTRSGPRGDAFTTFARCVTCGKRILFVPAERNRQDYWRKAA